MDNSKAFASLPLPHGLVISKLHSYDLSFNACCRLTSCLCNMFQIVNIKNNTRIMVMICEIGTFFPLNSLLQIQT